MNKRFSLLLTGARMLVIFSIGMIAAVAGTPNGRSPIYTFDVMHEGLVVGEVALNTAHADPTYALVADGLMPNTNYTFGYSILEYSIGDPELKFRRFPHATSRITSEMKDFRWALPASAQSLPKPSSAMSLARARRTSAKAYSVVLCEA